MTALSVERLRREGQAFMEEMSREYYLTGAGIKQVADLQLIYQRHKSVIGAEALDFARQLLRDTPAGSEEHRQARMLVEWLAELQSSRELAPLEEREIAWEGAAVVRLDGDRQVEFQRVAIEIANSRDRRERLALEKAKNVLVGAELAPLRRERFERERQIIESLGLADGYNATFEALSGIELAGLAAQCEAFLDDTQDLWDDTFPRFVRKVLHIEPNDATRADAVALFHGHEFDEQFPSSSMEWEIRRQVREMGIDPIAGGRVLYDTEDRPSKRARAFCAPARVPDEVYLVLRPHGGQSDWSTFLHELGHALHFANMGRDLPFEYRWLGDNSITEGYAMLFDHLMQDQGWLKRYTPLSAGKLDAFVRATAFYELHMIRRYAAKLLYEIDLHGGRYSYDQLPDLFVQRLTRATSFRYSTADAFVDVDPRYYAARYLRAWQLQALITETLRERYNEDWWRNPRAGPWVVGDLFAMGQRELAPEQAKRISGKELGFGPLLRAIERELA
ncbi:MAG TPA: hypothetical protein VFO55_06165 [Gemmatimonadaceae bacterium]|nr:hypothetical protein [Gemmatimonadaceae bacterium]